MMMDERKTVDKLSGVNQGLATCFLLVMDPLLRQLQATGWGSPAMWEAL